MKSLDLAPAHWIWWPSQRTLPNTFVLFRREIELRQTPSRAYGHISADSRYLLWINGRRVQWGPAPCDPRFAEADPFDATPFLRVGKNVLAVEVLHYGQGDGTWAGGKPGLLLKLEVETQSGAQTVVSDENWDCLLDRAHAPGAPKRWFLRALQEKFDARLHPQGWRDAAYETDERWLPAMQLDAPADKPALCGSYEGNDLGDGAAPADCALGERAIPLLRERWTPARLAEMGRVQWRREVDDWFESRTPHSFEIERADIAHEENGAWVLPATGAGEGVFLTFELAEQIVGWPAFEIEAPAGTTVELITQEAHDAQSTLWLDTSTSQWARLVCREGHNRFQTFDFESLRWIQLHVHGSPGPVRIREVGVLRRSFPWPNAARIETSDAALQRLFEANLNTLENSAQETCVDGMGRERQQYSGDGGHQLRAVRWAWGETRLPARFLETWSHGLTPDGYFLDCWPGYDRLARLMQRAVGTTIWGPLLDHGVGFGFDCWLHFWESGDGENVRAPFQKLKRFSEFLGALRGGDGLLPVENLGVPSVWIDHEAYREQAHKQCAFNLYAAAMWSHALAPLARALGEDATRFEALGREVLSATIARFWDEQTALFVVNRPNADEEPRLCDRSLATAILFDQCPRGQTEQAAQVLAQCPPQLGLSYPANALWRLLALGKTGHIAPIIGDLRETWAQMPSVVLNNTLQESWRAMPDSREQWSHCAVAPLCVAREVFAGIRPLAPGYQSVEVRPQLGDLPDLQLTVWTPRGPIYFAAQRENDGHQITVTLPPNCQGQLVLGDETKPLVGGSTICAHQRNF